HHPPAEQLPPVGQPADRGDAEQDPAQRRQERLVRAEDDARDEQGEHREHGPISPAHPPG
ncbi:hypothetical protein LJD39_26025, partial [Escherichia coli]|nr:hypothetical protein [Escherichia coli]